MRTGRQGTAEPALHGGARTACAVVSNRAAISTCDRTLVVLDETLVPRPLILRSPSG